MTPPEKCPKCQSPLRDGWDNLFTCGTTYYHDGPLAGKVEERSWCWKLQRDQLADEVARLRRDDWVGGACLHLMAQHGVPIGSPELLEAKARVEAEISALRTANAALMERVHAAEAVLTDPHVLWTNWLRGAVKLPAGIGDVRECTDKMKRFRSRWLAAHKRMTEMENEAELASERVKRLEAAGDEMAAWLRNPRNLGGDEFMADEWDAAKGQP